MNDTVAVESETGQSPVTFKRRFGRAKEFSDVVAMYPRLVLAGALPIAFVSIGDTGIAIMNYSLSITTIVTSVFAFVFFLRVFAVTWGLCLATVVNVLRLNPWSWLTVDEAKNCSRGMKRIAVPLALISSFSVMFAVLVTASILGRQVVHLFIENSPSEVRYLVPMKDTWSI
jgi:hypothetical protein